MVDANQAWTRIAAARACRALAPFDLGWVEEPLDADDITGLADLRTAVDVPIAAGETAYGLRGIGLLLSADAVDVIQPDLMRCGGTVSYTHLRAHETDSYLVCRLLLEKKKK